MTGDLNIDERERVIRDDLGRPVSLEIYVEEDGDGFPNILRSVEITGADGCLILSQAPVDEESVLLIYRKWRSRPENQDRILRVEAPEKRTRKRKTI